MMMTKSYKRIVGIGRHLVQYWGDFVWNGCDAKVQLTYAMDAESAFWKQVAYIYAYIFILCCCCWGQEDVVLTWVVHIAFHLLLTNSRVSPVTDTGKVLGANDPQSVAGPILA
jgi:hypothetical protein